MQGSSPVEGLYAHLTGGPQGACSVGGLLNEKAYWEFCKTPSGCSYSGTVLRDLVMKPAGAPSRIATFDLTQHRPRAENKPSCCLEASGPYTRLVSTTIGR